MNMKILEGTSRSSLADRYREGEPGVVALFGKHYSRTEHWLARAAELDGRSRKVRADGAAVAEALRKYQLSFNASPPALRSLDRLGAPDALAVVGGQQAGLFGGSLLIYYKALTVIQTAKEAEKRLGRPVVPVFWIAGEDHDFDEANHVFVQSHAGALKRIRLERPAGPRQAVSRTRLSPESWQRALGELAAELPDTAFKPELLANLWRIGDDGPTLSLAFARLLAEWFGSEGLVVLDADDERLRALEGGMFRELILRNGELGAALQRGADEVELLGLPLQVERSPGSAHLFVHHEAGRLLLGRTEDGTFADRRGAVSLTENELLALADGSPQLLSTNALTRPLMQDYVLPVLATVLGPAELAYWGALGPAFAAFGMQMPVLVPRQQFVYVEPEVAYQLGKFGLTSDEALRGIEEHKIKWLASQDDGQLEAKFRETKESFTALYAPLLETVAAVQPGLQPLAETNRDKILEQIAFLENRSLSALAARHEAVLRQWDRIGTSLLPGGKPQERVLGTIHFWNRYGPDWLALWREVPFDPSGNFRLIEA